MVRVLLGLIFGSPLGTGFISWLVVVGFVVIVGGGIINVKSLFINDVVVCSVFSSDGGESSFVVYCVVWAPRELKLVEGSGIVVILIVINCCFETQRGWRSP